VTVHTVVIGAGPAGLATSRELLRRNVDHLVLERGQHPGHTWRHLYDSLVLHTGKHLSALPGLRFPDATPLFPTRHDFVAYLDRYVTTFRLPVRTGADVARVTRQGDTWSVHTTGGEDVRARAVVVASGIAANPFVPAFPNRDRFRGRVRHSIDYQNPIGLAGERVLVVGAGNSAGEIAAEMARAGARVTLAVRNGAHVVPRDVLGVPIQYLTQPLNLLPARWHRPVAASLGNLIARFKSNPVLPPPGPTNCPHVPLIGLHLVNEIRRGAIALKGGIASFTTEGVEFADGSSTPFDEVILATGFRAAMTMFGREAAVDECGFGLRTDRVVSTTAPDLYFVGHNPDIRGGIYMIGRDARRVAKLIGRRS
jgi:indole-3-pyruvate monooxygenase